MNNQAPGSKLADASAPKHPLSFSQERLWFIEQLEPGTPVHNVPWATRINGVLNLHSLQHALDEVAARHPALRTSYHEEDGIPFQLVHPPMPVCMDIADLSSLPLKRREIGALARLDSEIAKPFDLGSGKLLRAVVLRIDEQEHILLLLSHHIASDGWSHGIINRDLSMLYNAAQQGATASLPPLPLDYSDYVQQQRESLQGARLAHLLQYWTTQLKDLPPTLPLPADRVRGSAPDYTAASIPVEIEATLTSELNQLARNMHATPFMLLTAAWMVILSRYANEDDISIGIPIAGRRDQNLENVVGFFVNTLVLRVDLSGEPTFGECVQRVRNTCLDAYEHQEVPFAKLVAELRPQRHQNLTPLIQVMFAFGNLPSSPICLNGASAQPVALHPGTAKFDLRLDLQQTTDGIQGHLDYKTELFDRWRMAQLAQHFKHVLRQLIANPTICVNSAELCTRSEIQHVTNCLTGPYAKTVAYSLQEALEQQAAKTPTAIAVRESDHELTYSQLHHQADSLASRLRSSGIQRGDRVGLCLHSSSDSVLGILGILKIGAAYVPLEPLDPPERLAHMMADASVRCVLTHRKWVATLQHLTPSIIVLDDEDNSHSSPPLSPAPERIVGNSELAYVLFTSGSTGRPKGVAIEQRSVLNYVSSMLDQLQIGAGATFCWLQPLSADTSVTTLFGALLSGGCIIVVPKEHRANADYLAALFGSKRIDVLKIAPTHMQALLQAAEEPRTLLPQTSLILGGEASPWGLVKHIRSLNPNLTIFNHYGPTETTVGVTTYAVPAQLGKDPQGSVPIGRPLHNVTAYVVDPNGQRCPMGIQGELWIGGACLAREYVHDEASTRASFARDPFSSAPNARVYRTGDQVVLDADGNLRFVGRLDHQVKIRGFRVEPAESEDTLLALPDVADAAVVPQLDAEGQPQLIGYVVPTEGTSLKPNHLHAALAPLLPSHMIPSGFVILPSLPQSKHGKLDVSQLPTFVPPPASPLDETALHLSSTERQLVAIWEDILNRRPIGRDLDFFDLGGHSLLALRLLSRISTDFGLRIPIRLLFDHPTIAEVADFIENQG